MCRCVAVWIYDCGVVLMCGCIVVWECGSVVWMCCCMGVNVWLYCCLGVWFCCMDVLLYGCECLVVLV